MVATAALGSGAVLWGVLTGSQVILFDGVYTLAGIILGAVSLLASRAASAAPSTEYPFGRHAARPLAVALQGAAIMGTLVYGIADAVVVILNGGTDGDPVNLIVYGLVTALLSVLLAGWLRRYARRSALAEAEMVSWRASILLSSVVALGGVVGMLLYGNESFLVRYVDPVLLLIACVLVAPMALHLVRDGIRELLEAAPPKSLQAEIDAAVEEVRCVHDLPPATVRATKLGKRLYVEVDFLVPQGQWRVDEEDEVRMAIVDRLNRLDDLAVWATVDLTTQAWLIDD